MTTTKKDTNYTHENFDPKWNKVTLNKSSRSHVLLGFKEEMRKPYQAFEKDYAGLGPKVEKWYLDNLIRLSGASVSFVERQVKLRDSGEHTALNRAVCIEVVMKAEAGEGATGSHRFYAPTKQGEHRGTYFVPCNSYQGGTTKVKIPVTSALGREIAKKYKDMYTSQREYLRLTEDFEILLASCRNIGQLLKKWPSAIDYIPEAWKGNDVGKELAPINITDFDKHVKGVKAQVALIKKVGD